MIEIFSTDGGSLAVLRFGNVFRIGDIKQGYVFNRQDHLTPCNVLTWDFYGDGEKDYFYFSDKGLLFSALGEGRPDYLIRTYFELINKKADMSTFVNVVRGEFILQELGF